MSMSVLKGIHRRMLGITKDDQVIARSGFVAGGSDRPAVVFPGPDTVALMEDFIGYSDTGVTTRYNDIWAVGFTDTGQALPASGVTPLTNGVFRMTSSATSAQTPEGGVQSLNGALNWKANQGRLRMSARLKIATLAGNSVFVGLADTGGTEMPAYDTGGGIITPAADYVGFICSGEGGSTQQAWRGVSGKAGTDQSATLSVTPVANVYNTLEVEVDASGNNAKFYVDGILKGHIQSDAVTATVALAPGVWRANTDGAANAVDIDWINVSAARDTGT